MTLRLFVHHIERIVEHQSREVLCGGCRMYCTLKSITHELRDAPDVVGMRVRHHKYIDVFRIVWEGGSICRVAHVFAPLIAGLALQDAPTRSQFFYIHPPQKKTIPTPP